MSNTVAVPTAFAELAAKLDPLSTAEEVSAVLHTPINTLNDWRIKGSGPKFIKLGRAVYYRRDDVLAWLDERTFTSTAEARKAVK